MFKLDKIDKSLLSLLDENARQSVTQLASVLGVSKQLVSFRLTRLEKKGVILEYSTYINRSKLGFQHYQVYLNLKNYNFKNLLEDLSKIPNIHWSATSRGKFNLVIYFLTKSQQDCYETYNKIIQTFSEFIIEKEYLVTAKSHYFNQSSITYMDKVELMIQEPQKRPRLKVSDFILLNLIKTDARISYSELSRKTGKSILTIKDRIKYLKKASVIKNFRARLNYPKLGYSHYQICIQTDNLSESLKEKLTKKLLKSQEILRVTETLGKWSVSCDVVLPKKKKIDRWVKTYVSKTLLKNLQISSLEIKEVLKVNNTLYK